MDDPRNLLKPGTRTCRCSSCGEYFTAPSVFDLHRVGQYPGCRCLDPAEIDARGLTLDARGRWTASLRVTLPDRDRRFYPG